MKYEKIKRDGYNLHLIKTDKFRTVNMVLNYVGPRDKKSTVCLELLEMVTLYVTKDYPNRIEFAKACANMYDLRMRAGKQQWGKYNVFNLSVSFINEKYTKKGMNKKSISFALKQFFNPLTSNGGFDKEIFEMTKKLYKEELISLKDNPELYSHLRLKEEMGKKDFYSYTAAEELNVLEKINEKNLYSFYKKVLKNYDLEIFIIGDIDKDEVLSVLDSKIKRKINDDTVKDFKINHSKIRSRIKTVIEPSDFSQSKLDMGFKTENLTPFERQYVSYMYGSILGGGTDSLLFDEVRGKRSLCYYIYTTGDARSNFFQIKSGIDSRNIKKVISIAKKCVQKMKDGDFDDKLIEQSKKCYINVITENEDYPAPVLADYAGTYFFEKDSMEIRKKKISEVTKEDIMNFAKKIHLDTIYVLRGDKNGD